MRITQLSISNYRALRDVTIPMSQFGCLIGENNSGKSSFLQALSLLVSGSRVPPSHFFDESKPIRIALTIEGIGDGDLARLVEEHRSRVAEIVSNGRLVLVRVYGTDGRSAFHYSALMPTDARFDSARIAELTKGQRPGQAFANKVLEQFPELEGDVDANMNQEAMKKAIQALAASLPDDQKKVADQPLPTGIDRSIGPMLPEVIYIPAVKDLADDIKTTESTPFGKILAILLQAVESKLPDAQKWFGELNSKLNRVEQPDGTVMDGRLEEVRLIESTVQKYVRESFADVDLRITIPPPELKTVFSSARIYANDGVDGLIDSKGDGLRRAVVFSILRSYVELRTRLAAESAEESKSSDSRAEPAPASYLLLFEEPELFLHPQAQQFLFDALRVFAEEHHVVVTTHSPMFLGAEATETFVKLRRVSEGAVAARPFTKAYPVDLSDVSAKDQFQIICFEHNNAAFFADTAVLVEGDSDYLLLPHVARTIDPTWDVARRPIAFARINGKGSIRRYRQFFVRFGVRVPIIADLDLLLKGFQHIDPDDELKRQRQRLLKRVDELCANSDATGDEPSSGDAREAHVSGELRGLWRRVKERQGEQQTGACTLDELSQAVDEFFAFQRQSDRLDVLQHSNDDQLRQLKWKLLEMLRAVDVYVLERGAIEDYYPDNIVGADKPSRAQDFCTKVATREAVFACCGEQECQRDGALVRESELKLIFEGIFGEQPVRQEQLNPVWTGAGVV